MLTADDDDFIVRRLLILLDVLMAFAYILELFAYCWSIHFKVCYLQLKFTFVDHLRSHGNSLLCPSHQFSNQVSKKIIKSSSLSNRSNLRRRRVLLWFILSKIRISLRLQPI